VIASLTFSSKYICQVNVTRDTFFCTIKWKIMVFNFSPPQIPDEPNADVDEQTQILLTTDFEIGHYIREKIIPRAVLYFTGRQFFR